MTTTCDSCTYSSLCNCIYSRGVASCPASVSLFLRVAVSIPQPEPLQTLHCSPWLCFDSKRCALHATTTFRATWWFVDHASARKREEISTFITWRGSADPPPVSILLPQAEVEKNQIQRRRHIECHTPSMTRETKKGHPRLFRRGRRPLPTLQCSKRPFQDARNHNICRSYQIR